jgi:hypothetical protein
MKYKKTWQKTDRFFLIKKNFLPDISSFVHTSVACLGHVYVHYIPKHFFFHSSAHAFVHACTRGCALSFFLDETTAHATRFYPTSQVCMFAMLLLVAKNYKEWGWNGLK